ncbi:unnamed protein product [Mytilus coruscus]|uniref:MAM domain-containing protein n=1 Tax=Mytilus coruscus TaxID=42192 RepID=A0A6J8DSR1_MYTCO|nr:unnamed protein product [Mytilus coruscus]
MTVKQTTTTCSEYDQCSLTDEQMNIIKNNCDEERSCSITSLVPTSCLFNNYGHLNISYSCKENLDNSCNFESGKCGWTVIGQYTYKWEIGSGLTHTRRTGPYGDHKTSFGHYIYTESRGNSSLNDESNLLSGWIVASPKQCLSFWYHMYGKSINKLVVFQMNSSYNIDLWNISNDQGNEWYFKSLTLKNIGLYQIMFKAIRGMDRTSDIAIDDIVITNNACNGFALDCNFETEKCNWASDLTTSYMWANASGKTKTPNTGPNNDHTTGSSKGHYIYLEATEILSGTKSELISTIVNLTGQFCFTFWYHMYGKGMGTLNVYIKSANTTTKYWSRSGDQGRNWKFVDFDILSLEPYMVIFEGIRGDNYTSDIALDDIVLLQSSCSGWINYSQTCLNKAESISLPECSKYYLQLNNLVFDGGFDNCSVGYKDAQGLCDDVDNSDICTFNLSEVIRKEPRCLQSNMLLVEYTCEDRVPTILSDDSQLTTRPLHRGLVVGMVVAIVFVSVCFCVNYLCRQKASFAEKTKSKTEYRVTADTNNQNCENIGTNDNQCDMQMNENTSFIKGLKQKTDTTKFSKGLDHYETRFAGSESYELANPRSSIENKQILKTEQDDMYCQSEEGNYDISGCNRHKQTDGNIYSHTVDDVYDSTIRKRNDDDQEDKYDHFIGQKTEDLYDISMQS